ncbi:MFS transporter [Notoacmeibacter sp. MSK16QG-6]|nr:MFS transporter [Notoacmeibacter sp. MSK16QG-6]
MQFAKFSVTFADLTAHYQVSDASIALVLSSVGIMGIVFGTAAGALVGSIGPRRAIIVACLIGILASIVQTLLPPFAVVMASRLLEGVSHLLIVVAAPTAIIANSAARHRSLTMGLWATFFGVAYAIAGLIAPTIQNSYGFSALYGLHAALLIVLLGAYLLVGRRAPPVVIDNLAHEIRKAWLGQFTVYRSLRKSAPGLAFFWHTLLFVALLTFLPGLASDEETTRLLATVLPLVTIVGSFAGGAIAQKAERPIGQLQFTFAIFGVLAISLAFVLQGPAYPVLACVTMFISGIVQASSFSAIPQLCHSEADQAESNGAITQLGNLGATCGTPLFAAALSMFGNRSVPLLATIIAVAAVVMLVAIARWRPAGIGSMSEAGKEGG